MERKSLVKEKSFVFSLKIIELYKYLKANHEFIVSRQLLKSGTAIGANICEALAGESSRDFLHKMSLASKEARETYYWLSLLNDSQMVKYDYKRELGLCKELIRMLTSIVKTSAANITKD